MEQKPASTLTERIIRWTVGIGGVMAIVPAVWGFANYFAHNDQEEVIGGALVCSDVDGFFSYTVARQDWTTDVTRTQDYFFFQHETFYIDRNEDYRVDIVEHRTSMILGEPQVRRYERRRDIATNPDIFFEADLEYEEQIERFSLP